MVRGMEISQDCKDGSNEKKVENTGLQTPLVKTVNYEFFSLPSHRGNVTPIQPRV
jgi:hypothetical protein